MNTIGAMEPPLAIPEVQSLLTLTKDKRPANTIDNFQTVIQRDAMFRDAFRYNDLTERVDIVRDLGWKRRSVCLDDIDMKYLLAYFEKNYGLYSEKKIYSAIIIEANEHHYHPIQDRLNSLTWDGIPRIRTCLHHFLGVEINDYTETMFKHFLMGAIERVFHPGCKFDEVLCLVGGQGVGKSTFFRYLAIEDDWFTDDLKHLDDDKVYQKLQGHWIIEMSEMLAVVNAKSIEELRSFISRQKESYRTPYEAQSKDRLRQCVFAGTSNSIDFLPLDRAGNRRFLPIQTQPDRAEVHILDEERESRDYLLQVWAEAMTLYRSGNYTLKFSKEMRKYLMEYQREFMAEDTEAGMIQDFLETFKGEIVCTRQLYREALQKSDEPKRYHLRAIADIMNSQVTGWTRFNNPRSFGILYGRQKGWMRTHYEPPPDNEKPGNKEGFIEYSGDELRQIGLPEEWLE